MLKTSKIKVDDKLLELISADSLRVNRFGLYVTVAAIVFILILCTTSLWFIKQKTSKCLPLSLRCIRLSGKWSSHNPTVPFVPPAEVTSTPK